jgi:hypothetical protein
MRSRDEIREEVIRQLAAISGFAANDPLGITREVDRRYHCERIVEEAEAYERTHGRVRIEFIAVPDDHLCARCRALDGQSISFEDFKKEAHIFSCRCAVVLPEEE